MNTLLIVESPAKCKKIAAYAGDGYSAMATYGHILELSDGLTSIGMTTSAEGVVSFAPKYELAGDGKKRKNIAMLGAAIRASDQVIIATDDDREGEFIGYSVLLHFRLPLDTPRILFHEITEDVIQTALSSPTTLNMNIVRSAQTRQIMDMLVGYKVSPALWRRLAFTDNGLSAGRCQTPALKLIYENYVERHAAGDGAIVHDVVGWFSQAAVGVGVGGGGKIMSFKLSDPPAHIREFLEASKTHVHMFSCSDPTEGSMAPPTPLTTSRIQQIASNEFHYSPKQTMNLCQRLYEGGYITYMRTDSTKYSDEFSAIAREYIATTFGHEYVGGGGAGGGAGAAKFAGKSRGKVTKKSSSAGAGVKVQGAHEAIRPTDILTTHLTAGFLATAAKGSHAEGARLERLYGLIRNTTLASLMSYANYIALTANVTAPPVCSELCAYVKRARKITFDGWTRVKGVSAAAAAATDAEDADDSMQLNEYDELLSMRAKSRLRGGAPLEMKYEKITATSQLHGVIPHYTEAKLVKLLESHGIGRPSTFSYLVDKIQDRHYVEKQHVPAKTHVCIDYELTAVGGVAEKQIEKQFGGERDKLIIQPLGIHVMEFLQTAFSPLFEYNYTSAMEKQLDIIAGDSSAWEDACAACCRQIDALLVQPVQFLGAASADTTTVVTDVVVKVNDVDADAIAGSDTVPEKKRGRGRPKKQTQPTAAKPGKLEYKIDDTHNYIIGKHGPVIACKDPETGKAAGFMAVKSEINIEKLKAGEYTLDEIAVPVAVAAAASAGSVVGEWHGVSVCVKKGRFGLYATCGDRTVSLKKLGNRPVENVTWLDVEPALRAGIVREISADVSIRLSPKGSEYVYVRTANMKKPDFYKLATFCKDTGCESHLTCPEDTMLAWIETKKHASQARAAAKRAGGAGSTGKVKAMAAK